MQHQAAVRIDNLLVPLRRLFAGSKGGTQRGYGPQTKAPGVASGGSFVRERVVGAERFERSTS